MKKFKILLVAILTSIVVSAFSQVPEKAMEQPIKYITPQENVSLTKSMERRPGSYWVVFSDRQGNKTYEKPTGNRLKQTIGFMDDYYVAEETDERVHIFKDPDYKEGFSSLAEDYGWMDKENLLLWDHCLVTKERKINLKAMLLNTTESVKIKEEKVQYYNDDQLTIESSHLSKSYKFHEVLYVYKVKDGAMLLGKNYTTDANHAKEEILGWISSKKVILWNHRVAVESNWDEEAAMERKQKNVRTTFFMDAYEAKRYSEGETLNIKGGIWDDDSYQERKPGNWLRFPLLNYNKETGIIKAAVLNQTNDSVYYPAYSSMKVKGLEYPLYKFVLFMTLRELGDLLTKFDALSDAFKASDQRQKLKEVWVELLASHTGDEMSKEQILNMTFEEINDKLFGLPGTGNLLHIRLRDITDPSIVSNDEFIKYVQSIKNKRFELDKILNNKNYEYGFYSNDTHYFWISQDLLP